MAPGKKHQEGTPRKKQARARPSDDDFAAWWSTYPRKEAKKAAAKAYPKAVAEVAAERKIDPDAAVTWLLERTIVFAASDKGRGDYCPHPATWLNGARYDDDPAEWRDSGNGKGAPAAPAKFWMLKPPEPEPQR